MCRVFGTGWQGRRRDSCIPEHGKRLFEGSLSEFSLVGKIDVNLFSGAASDCDPARKGDLCDKEREEEDSEEAPDFGAERGAFEELEDIFLLRRDRQLQILVKQVVLFGGENEEGRFLDTGFDLNGDFAVCGKDGRHFLREAVRIGRRNRI